MAFTDVINDYTNGATGTLTDVNGFTIDYTVSGTSSNVNWNGLSGGAKVNGNGTQSFTVTLEYPATGVAIQMSGSDTTEAYYIEIDGVTVDLQQMVDNGEATFTTDGTHVLRPDGGINGGHYSDGSIAVIVFNVPVTSIGAYGSGASSGNWDYFEVGIDSTAFDVVCLASGTEITTAGTAVRVEDLVIGDLVKTHENGYAPVSWTGSRHVTAEVLSKEPRLRPVRIKAGALGNGLPRRDLLVSPQHRILISSRVAERMFGTAEVLIPARKLTDLPNIFVDDSVSEVTYHHILFARHEVIFAEGAPTESLFTGRQALRGLAPEARAEILKLFPELDKDDGQPALHIPSGRLQKKLIERHDKNGKPLLELFVKPAG